MNYYTPTAAQSATHFFSAIPRHVFALRQTGALKARDVEVLGLLLDYKRRGTTTVEPSQGDLCRRLCCSHDTIQRSVNRLVAAGLVIATRLRDLRGRLGKYVYDLAAVFALMPRNAAKMRTGNYGEDAADAKPASTHESAVHSVDSSCSVKADNRAAAEQEAAEPPLPKKAATVVSELLTLRTERKTAVTIVSRHGEEICTAALAMLGKQKSVSNPAGWLRTCLSRGWVEKEQRAARQEKPAAGWKINTNELILSACTEFGRVYVHAEMERRYAAVKAAGRDVTRLDEIMAWFKSEVL